MYGIISQFSKNVGRRVRMSLSGRTVKLLADNSRAGQGRAGQFQVNAGQFHDNAGQFQGNIILLKIKKEFQKEFI